MEFGKKLQELRKQKGLTQEELATRLYVSRTAVSKWESGRGTPSIASLKEIARFFSVTVDELLSSDELLSLADAHQRQTKKHLQDTVLGLLDLAASLLWFLPFFAVKGEGSIRAVSLLFFDGVSLYLKVACFALVILTSILGIATLALQNWENFAWIKMKTPTSLSLGVLSVLVLTVCLQPYAAVFAFFLLISKALILVKRS